MIEQRASRAQVEAAMIAILRKRHPGKRITAEWREVDPAWTPVDPKEDNGCPVDHGTCPGHEA